MYHVTLGNLGYCTPDDADPSGCTEQTDWGLSNTGPFSDLQSGSYFGTEFDSSLAWRLNFLFGNQGFNTKNLNRFAWAVRTGDVPAICSGDNCEPPAVPIPAAAWLFGSGLLGLIGIARRRAA